MQFIAQVNVYRSPVFDCVRLKQNDREKEEEVTKIIVIIREKIFKLIFVRTVCRAANAMLEMSLVVLCISILCPWLLMICSLLFAMLIL